jgi:hypothetical protein
MQKETVRECVSSDRAILPLLFIHYVPEIVIVFALGSYSYIQIDDNELILIWDRELHKTLLLTGDFQPTFTDVLDLNK